MLKAFTAATGIRVNFIFASSGLIERMAAEGRNSPADVLLTNESGLLIQAVEAGTTAPLHDAVLEQAIPAPLRDPEGNWFGLTKRARVVYASRDRVKETAITYEELAEPKWHGRICTRSGQHTYNIALIASMIAHHGAAEAETWLKGLKANLAHKPAGGDREAVRDVAASVCDIAIGNTYYLAQIIKSPDTKAWADRVRIIFPNAGDRGAHVNISGMALARYAPDRDNAVALMRYLVSPEAQNLYAEVNGEYPVVEGVAVSPLVASWGELKGDSLPLAEVSKLRRQASELVDKVRFDQGPNS